MVTKTTPLRDDTHKRLKDIQAILHNKHNINMSIQDIIAYFIPSPEEGFKKIIEKIAMANEDQN